RQVGYRPERSTRRLRRRVARLRPGGWCLGKPGRLESHLQSPFRPHRATPRFSRSQGRPHLPRQSVRVRDGCSVAVAADPTGIQSYSSGRVESKWLETHADLQTLDAMARFGSNSNGRTARPPPRGDELTTCSNIRSARCSLKPNLLPIEKSRSER